MIFTIEELESYNIDQLRSLAKYFVIGYNAKTSKGKLIERIYTHLGKVNDLGEMIEINLPPASVRVQRIRQSVKEN